MMGEETTTRTESAESAEPATARTRYRRLRFTPLRDLVRGRLSGRLDLEPIIERKDLPAPLAELVRTATRRTRLWRGEQAAVAGELASRFADGLAAGREPDELIEAFGDPRGAARTIRRKKKQDRPRIWIAMRYFMFGFGFLFIAYLVAGLYFLLGTPDPKIDYRVHLNAVARRVPEADRAWPLYRAALLQLPPLPTFDEYNRPPRPSEIGWEPVAEYLSRNASAIALAREAATRSGLGFPLGYAPGAEERALWPTLRFHDDESRARSMINVTVPHLEGFRRLARTLALDARRAAADGDGDLVVADLEAILALARHLREAPIFINDLVAYSIVLIAVQTAGDVLADHPEALTTMQLRGVAHAFATCDPSLTPRCDGERLIFEDVVQRVYTDNGRGSGRLTMAGYRRLHALVTDSTTDGGAGNLAPMPLLPAVHAIMLSRREILEEHERLMTMFEAEAARPLWEADISRADRQIEAWKSSSYTRLRHLPITLLVPALGRSYVSAQLISAERDALLVAIALVAHHRRHGVWPRSPDELDSAALPAWPRDRFDGAALRYVIRDGRPIVYSVGTDRDDDGGASAAGSGAAEHRYDAARRWLPGSVIEAARAEAQVLAGGRLVLRVPGEGTPLPDGDWVLWPRPPAPIRRLDTF